MNSFACLQHARRYATTSSHDLATSYFACALTLTTQDSDAIFHTNTKQPIAQPHSLDLAALWLDYTDRRQTLSSLVHPNGLCAGNRVANSAGGNTLFSCEANSTTQHTKEVCRTLPSTRSKRLAHAYLHSTSSLLFAHGSATFRPCTRSSRALHT